MVNHKKYFKIICWYVYNFISLNVKANLLISEMGMLAYFYTKPSVLAEYLMPENREPTDTLIA